MREGEGGGQEERGRERARRVGAAIRFVNSDFATANNKCIRSAMSTNFHNMTTMSSITPV